MQVFWVPEERSAGEVASDPIGGALNGGHDNDTIYAGSTEESARDVVEAGRTTSSGCSTALRPATWLTAATASTGWSQTAATSSLAAIG